MTQNKKQNENELVEDPLLIMFIGLVGIAISKEIKKSNNIK